MKRMLAVLLLSILGVLCIHAQTPDPAALSKLRTAALVVHATTSVSCGDGSEGTCVRTDSDVVAKVKSIVDDSEIWQHFQKAEATKADALFEFTVTNASTTYAKVDFFARDADSNKVLYEETRGIVVLENDITRIVAHFLKVVEDAKKKRHDTKRH